MEAMRQKSRKKIILFAVIFCGINILALFFLAGRESKYIQNILEEHAGDTKIQFEGAMDDYERSFQLLAQMMRLQIEKDPDPEAILAYLKKMDPVLLGIEGATYDGIYMYYQGRYLYSWDTPYSVYEASGYDATERPWYQDAIAGDGSIVFTPPYMSYANHYILTTISQLQPDRETVLAYDIKMGDIQELVTSLYHYSGEQVMIFESGGTVIGSTDDRYLGGNLRISYEETLQAVSEARQEMDGLTSKNETELAKAQDKYKSAEAFSVFRKHLGGEAERLLATQAETVKITMDGTRYYAYLLSDDGYGFLILVPTVSILMATAQIWLIPLLILELLLFYVFARIEKEGKNRELRDAYIELGQTHRRLEIALSAAQKAAAIDDLTGMMNYRSFRKQMVDALESMQEGESGILIMLDGDHFKQINDNYGHNAGDEVIKLSAQMIVGRIRTVDLASRLHGDEFAIFVSNTDDYSVAERIMQDINQSIAKEAVKRKLPPITLSAGAVIARHGDSFVTLSKLADAALYRAKESHNGAFCN